MSDALTVVMYHFVQPADAGPVRGLKILELSTFERQLRHIAVRYSVVSAADVLRAIDDGARLPPRPLLLTFDDGYKGHHAYVLPLLERFGMSAVFFPVAAALVDRELLDINKIQSTLAAAPDVDTVVAAIEAGMDEASRAGYRQRWWKASRWDPAAVTYVKRLLQHALPEPVRRALVDALFRRFVSRDERAIADELYMTIDEVRDLRDAGMTIGAHADRHTRLPTLDRAGQAREIDGALRVLDAVGLPRRPFVFGYANGEYDATSLDLLAARGCTLAFTTRAEAARIEAVNRLELPRLDTNDLPV